MKMSKKSNDNITVKANGVDNCGTITGNNYFAEIRDNIKSGVDAKTPYMYGNWGVLHSIKKEENMMNLYEVYIIDIETGEFHEDKIVAQKDWTAIHEAWGNSGFGRTLDDYKVETRVICSWAKKE